MSLTPNSALVPDRDCLPLKKRDQRLSPLSQQQQQQQQQCDAETFKTPYPHKSLGDFRAPRTSPFQPVARRVPALYQPWMQLHPSIRSKPHPLSGFREPHSWTEWRGFNQLPSGWDIFHHYQHSRHFPVTPVFHPDSPHHTSIISPTSFVPEGLSVNNGYDWEQLKSTRGKGSYMDRQTNGRNKGPYTKAREKKVECLSRFENSFPSSMSTCLPRSLQNDHLSMFRTTSDSSNPASKHPLKRVSPGRNSETAKEGILRSELRPSSKNSSSSSSPSNHFPWLIPHFVAGSLIELRDGRLRQVEHLQTEDFLLGSLACPDLRLSCCTVQRIIPHVSPSSSSSSSSCISRLLILLHELQTQELVDVYVEYPFFVRGQGWSSCCPQRTARLCGLQCRQLSVGDVCLALTPVSAAPPPLSVTLTPKTSPSKSEGGREALQAPQPHVLPEPQQPAGGEKEVAEAARRRHCSAPELRHLEIHCMELEQ